jgi:recombination protein RecT
MNENKSEWMQTLTTAYPKFEQINPNKAKSELGFAMQIFQNNPSLQRCDPQSILNAVVNVARTSITLNPVMRLAYLIPRKNKCILEFSYMGLVAMLRDNGCIKSISAHIVYEDENFEFDLANNKIKHLPKYAQSENEHNLRKIIGCYSRATLPNNEVVYEFMPMWEIDKVKRSSEGSDNKYSAWNTWKDEMIKKSVIKRHFKMLISVNVTEALTTALSIENENNLLVNDFNKSNNVVKPKLTNAFDDFNVDEEKIKEHNSVIEVDFFTDSISDDEIELLMNKEPSSADVNKEISKSMFDEEDTDLI